MDATPHDGGEIVAHGSVDLNADDPGPLDPSILYDQEDHVSSAIWEGLVNKILFFSFSFRMNAMCLD